MLSNYVVPSFQQHKLPVLGPPVWIGHRDSVWHAPMNATPILYQNATNATPKACLLDSSGLPREGHFLQFLFSFYQCLPSPSCLFFSPCFWVTEKKKSQRRPESNAVGKESPYSLITLVQKYKFATRPHTQTDYTLIAPFPTALPRCG